MRPRRRRHGPWVRDVARLSPRRTTPAAGTGSLADTVSAGRVPATGFVNQDGIALDTVLANRFGRGYAQHEMVSRLAS